METIFNNLIDLSYGGLHLTLNGLWLSAVFAGISWLIWRSVKKADAATGYIAWWVVMFMVIVAPFFAGSSPLLTASMPDNPEIIPVSEASRKSVDVFPGYVISTPEAAHPVLIERDPANLTQASMTGTLVIDASNKAFASSNEVIDSKPGRPILSLLLGLLPLSLFGIWLLVLAVLLLRLVSAYRRISSIKRDSIAFDTDRLPRVHSLIQRLGARRAIRVRLSPDINMPMAAGLGSPVVLIPERLPDILTEDELEAIILHELAHFQRWDDWTKLGQRLVQASMFFNPVIHWIGRQLDLAREIACDDQVVAQTGRPNEYARCLGRLTQLTVQRDALLIPGALTSRKQIFKRFDNLLNNGRNNGQRVSRSRIIGVFVSLAVALIITIQFAPLIAVPVQAVTFGELAETVQILAADLIPDPSPVGPPVADPVVAADRSGTGGDGTEREESQPVEDIYPANEPEPSIAAEEDPTGREPGSPGGNSELPADDIFPEETSEILAVIIDADQDDGGTNVKSGKGPGRVVDWNDDVFQLYISGKIHSPGWRYGDEDTYLTVWVSENKQVRGVMQGDVKFASDHRSVSSISPDGFVALKEDNGSVRRELDVTSESGGDFKYAYFVDGAPVAFNDDARAWMAGILVEMVPEMQAYDKLSDEDDQYVDNLWDDRPERRHASRGLLGRLVDWTSDVFDGFSKGTMITSDDDGSTSIMWSDGRNKLSAKLSGKVEFTDDDRAIKSISKKGYFSIMEKRGSRQWELDVEPESDGALMYGYYVNGKQREFDSEGREWLAGVLLDIIRKTGVGVEERAARIFKRDGVDGILAEISLIESDYVQRLYFSELLDNRRLSEDDYAKVVRQIARQLDSDYEKAELLISVADEVQGNPGLLQLFVAAVETIDSDYETRRVLSAVSFDNDTDKEVILTVLRIAGGIDSDYEKAELLIAIAPICKSDPALQQAYTDAIGNVESDYEKRRILSAIAQNSTLTRETLAEHIALASGISSDYEKAEMLLELSSQCEGDSELQAEIVRATASLESDYETRRVLSTLHYDCVTNPEIVEAILLNLEPRSSDYEKAELLTKLAGCVRDNNTLSTPYLGVVRRIDSDYEARKALTSLINVVELDEDMILAILPVVSKLGSDYEKAQILAGLAKYCRDNEKLEEAFLDAVDTIGSDYESNQLYAKLYRDNRRSKKTD